MLVRAYYNSVAFPNTLMLKVSNDEEVVSVETSNRVTIMKNDKNEIIAYNIHVELDVQKDGFQEMNEKLLMKINTVLEEDVNTTLVHDFTPYIVVGEVKTCIAHPDSDHLHICEVDVNEETLQIVCGASNVCEGIKVVVAKVNAIMPSGLLIQPGKLRGIESSGMLCSAYELGLISEKKKGILILEDSAVIGKPFDKGEFSC